MHFSDKYKNDTTQIAKDLSDDEESVSENDNKTKENEKENEKYVFRNCFNANLKYNSSNKHQFIWFITALNKNPYQENNLRPPILA